jgi:hypothetical protein
MVRFIDGPLDGEVFAIPHAPAVLHARRSVDTRGVLYVPDSREPPGILDGGRYRKATTPRASGELVYRFEE